MCVPFFIVCCRFSFVFSKKIVRQQNKRVMDFHGFSHGKMLPLSDARLCDSNANFRLALGKLFFFFSSFVFSCCCDKVFMHFPYYLHCCLHLALCWIFASFLHFSFAFSYILLFFFGIKMLMLAVDTLVLLYAFSFQFSFRSQVFGLLNERVHTFFSRCSRFFFYSSFKVSNSNIVMRMANGNWVIYLNAFMHIAFIMKYDFSTRKHSDYVQSRVKQFYLKSFEGKTLQLNRNT